MKYFLYFLLLAFCSCNTANNFYQGKVTDENGNPLDGVLVTEYKMKNETTTNKNGYFKLKRTPDWLGKLTFCKVGHKNESIPSVWHQSGETVSYNFVKKDTTVVKLKHVMTVDKLDLTITQPQSNNRAILENWTDFNFFPKEWIEVKKDENGYLIYEPCDGYTRSISIVDNTLNIKWQIEPENQFEIDNSTIITNKKSLSFDVYEENTQTKSFVTARIVDAKNGLVLWEFMNDKWLMTPLKNEINFRKIKNNCPDYKRNEMKFIEL